MMKRKYAFAVFAAFSVAATAAADEGSVKALLDEYVEKGLVAGVVSGISDASGEVRLDCAGWADMENKVPHEGAMRTDQRVNLKTGHSRLFFIQTENRGGQAFFSLKKKWNAACDAVQGTPPFNPKN